MSDQSTIQQQQDQDVDLSKTTVHVPLGPNPTLLSRTQIEALYMCLQAVQTALTQLPVSWIITGGSLLGAVRQHSILFCDDDVDVAILGQFSYDLVRQHLQHLLGDDYTYSIQAWECSDRVRLKRVSNVFLDIFCIRKYESDVEWRSVMSVKKMVKLKAKSMFTIFLVLLQKQ